MMEHLNGLITFLEDRIDVDDVSNSAVEQEQAAPAQAFKLAKLFGAGAANERLHAGGTRGEWRGTRRGTGTSDAGECCSKVHGTSTVHGDTVSYTRAVNVGKSVAGDIGASECRPSLTKGTIADTGTADRTRAGAASTASGCAFALGGRDELRAARGGLRGPA
eukprot:gene19470-23279_t